MDDKTTKQLKREACAEIRESIYQIKLQQESGRDSDECNARIERLHDLINRIRAAKDDKLDDLLETHGLL